MRATILIGDVWDRLSEMPDASVQCAITSPPYWGLRDYGTDGQMGLEKTPNCGAHGLSKNTASKMTEGRKTQHVQLETRGLVKKDYGSIKGNYVLNSRGGLNR
jgi:DNA modification methylase